MYSRLLTPPKNSSYFLFGPRGVGKTSWLRQTLPQALYLDLLEDETFTTLSAYPQNIERWSEQEHSEIVVIDEVQKIPKLLDEAHRLIQRKKLRFVLTGSSARKLKRSNINLLAGRALTCFLYPLTALELEDDFDLKRSLKFGHLPEAYGHLQPERFLRSYVSTYLKEEVQQEGLTRNIGAFSRFLEAASLSQAQVLSISNVARECAVERKVVEQYFTILEDLLLAVRIPVFSKRAKREVTKHPKFFLFDVGVYRSIRPKGPLDSSEEIDGAAMETLLFQEARALNEYLDLGYEFSYWRTRTLHEVDLVLYGKGGLIAFEVKRGSRVGTAELKGLLEFKRDYPVARTILLYGGGKRYKQDSIEIVPFAEGIKTLKDILA